MFTPADLLLLLFLCLLDCFFMLWFVVFHFLLFLFIELRRMLCRRLVRELNHLVSNSQNVTASTPALKEKRRFFSLLLYCLFVIRYLLGPLALFPPFASSFHSFHLCASPQQARTHLPSSLSVHPFLLLPLSLHNFTVALRFNHRTPQRRTDLTLPPTSFTEYSNYKVWHQQHQ